MVAIAEDKKILTAEEYFELEKTSEVRHEYYYGEIFSMKNTTKNHNKIARKIANLLENKLAKKGCEVYNENVSMEVLKGKHYNYPDVMLTCDERDLKDEYIVRYPSMIVEVLSKSTSDRDHGFKWNRYKRIPSLQYYIMISQYRVSVELYSRIEGKPFWYYQDFESIEDIINLDKLDISIPVKSIYENITLIPGTEEELITD